VKLQLDAKRSNDGIQADLSLDQLNLDVHRIQNTSSSDKHLDIQDGTIRNGQFNARISTDANGEASISGVTSKGDITAASMHYEGAGKNINTNDVAFSLDMNDQDVKIDGQGKVSGTMGREKLSLGKYGDLTIAAGSRADFEITSGSLSKEWTSGRLDAKGTLQGSLESGTLNLGDNRKIDLRGGDIDLNLRSINKKEGDLLPTFEGDIKVNLDAGADSINEKILKDAGVTSIKGMDGKLSLELQGASLKGDGNLEVQQSKLSLDAKIDEIQGKIQIPDLASAPSTGQANANSSIATEALANAPTVQLDAKTKESLAIQPMNVAKRIHNGTVEVEIPIQEKGIEDASKVLGVKTLDVQPGTTLKAKLVVKDGEIQYKDSSFSLNKPLSAMGVMDIPTPKVNENGELQVRAAGMDFNITDYVFDGDKMPSKVSEFVGQLPSPTAKPGSAKDSGPIDINGNLSTANDFIDVGQVKFKAEGVSLAPGRLQIGNNDFIELGPENNINISGTPQKLHLSGTVDAKDAYVDMGNAKIDLTQGQLNFDVDIQTGLSEDGQLNKPTTIKANLHVPDAQAKQLQLTQANGQQIDLRDSGIKDVRISTQQQFQVGNDGTIQNLEGSGKTTLDIGHFDGELHNTAIGLTNKDGSKGELDIKSACATGTLSLDEQGKIFTDIQVENVDAAVNDLNLTFPGSNMKGLDGSLRGQGNIMFDSEQGLQLNGQFHAEAKMDAGHLTLGQFADMDLSKNSRAVFDLQRLDTTKDQPVATGSLSISTELEKGNVQLVDGQRLRFDKGSKLTITSEFSQDNDGQVANIQGELFADLSRQNFRHSSGQAEISGTINDGTAKIDLGDIELHGDGRYKIKNPEIKLNMDFDLLGRQF